ncbi:YvrJ family protein [Priestia megaterium]|uniref:YvrJ family protein n=1 Tax=Priestia megaterium TaxID=1404 RepID=UPI002E22743E|nr:YvrJ family protein [Priestia megaterium]
MNQASIEVVLASIGNFGFPLVLAVYLLLRFEKKLESLTEAIQELSSCEQSRLKK